MTTRQERAAYIAQCEASVAAQREQIAASVLRQKQFEARITRMLEDVVAICNAPWHALMQDIRAL